MESSTLVAPDAVQTTPDWVQDAVFYQIFPDRFARSSLVTKPSNLEPWGSPPTPHGFQGGDLLGAAERLDYLQDLGITAVYFTPVFQSAANHRYHTHDYYVVDPILGGDEALRIFVDEAHRRDMRVILDGVFNHASRGFFPFSSILENGPESPYIDWFKVYSWPLHPYGPADEPLGYEAWWNLAALPKFNTSTPAVRDFLWNVGEHWIRAGIDGWRLDVPNEIDDDAFWREFRRRVKSADPDAYIVGEIWGDARRWLQGDQFDAVMNYLFTKACLGLFAGSGRGIDDSVIANSGLYPVQPLDIGSFAGAVEALLHLYPWQNTLAQLNLLGSHDTARCLTIARGDTSAIRLATLFQMTFPGAPCIYYGDEIGMEGGHDPDNRRAFPWNEQDWNEELRSYMKRAIALRHAHPVLRRGSYHTLHAADGVYAFARTLGPDIAIVALNVDNAPHSIDIPVSSLGALEGMKSVWGGAAPDLQSGMLRGWTLPGRSGGVLVAERQV